MADDIDLYETIRLEAIRDSTTRRDFLRTLGVAGAGTAGLVRAVENAFGATPDGKPVVHTYDVDGTPDRVRFVSEERYRRLEVFQSIPESFVERNPDVTGVTVTQLSDDPDDLVIEVFVEELTSDARQRLPDAIQNVPVTLTERPADDDGDYCSSRHTQYSDVRGGVSVGPYSNQTNYGTLSLVCYDDSGRVLITADHVMDGESTMYQPENTTRNVGSYAARSFKEQGQDTTKYTVDYGVTTSPLETIRSDVPDVTGSWDFFGLADVVNNGNSVHVQFSGANHCRAENTCVEATKYGARAKYQANMDDRNAGGGDSGASWVDDDGKLLAIHSGYIDPWFSSKYDAGAVGKQSLDAVNARLSP
jgi:hypothetical protein